MTLHVSRGLSANGTPESAPALDLKFPVRDIVQEALRVFASNPFGFFPKAQFWREIGIAASSGIRESGMMECILKELLLPIDSVWGIPRGHLPGPIVFQLSLRIPSVPALSDTPSVAEIRKNSELRILEKLAEVLIFDRGDLSVGRASSALGIDRAFVTTLIQELGANDLLARSGGRILPTPKMQDALGHHDLIVQVEAISKAPETNNDSSELYEGEIVFVVDVVSGFNTAEVLKPGEEALYFPSSLVAAKSSSILSWSGFSI